MSVFVIITAIGAKDRPGIIAAITGAVYESGGSLDDATMTRLHGAFANMLSARLPSESSVVALRSALEDVAARLDLHVSVDPIPDKNITEARREAPPDHLITVYGADKPGIVHRVATLLAAHGANITDMDTRLAGGSEKPVYVMFLETAGGDWRGLANKLADLAGDIGVEIGHKELEAESL